MLTKIAQSFLQLIYPSLCLHCAEATGKGEIFCANCLLELQLLEISDRCPFCFNENEMATLTACLQCRRNPPKLDRIAAACEEQGAAATLLHGLKNGQKPYLAKGAGALMVAQFLKLRWPFPDLIVPVPLTIAHSFERGYNQSQLLAEEIAALLSRPVAPILKRQGALYSQTGLSPSQRSSLGGKGFLLKSMSSIKQKTVLLIDDSLVSGATLRGCAEVLAEGEPQALYGLVFCKS